jgi:hypothetical protein
MKALRELILLLLFLITLYYVSYANRDVPTAHLMVKHLRHQLLNTISNKDDVKNNKKIKMYSFERIATLNGYWKWLRNDFVPNLRAQAWYNGQYPEDLRGYLNDKTNRIIGWAMMRQLRVKKGNSFFV